ncbi:MAG: glyoxalase, partial [Alphaproteobacteria bacterium]|nr:glyoxalase [Alphaproteobacteria bacterium]
ETALYVNDLDRAAAFYETIMCLPAIHADGRMRAYDVAGRGILLLFVRGSTLEPVVIPGGTIPPHDGTGPLHVAFSIEHVQLRHWKAHLYAHSVAIEGTAEWPRGGQSIYFRDPDGHLLELATPGLWNSY